MMSSTTIPNAKTRKVIKKASRNDFGFDDADIKKISL